MGPISRIVCRTSGGFVGGATGATILTGVGLVVGGGPIAAIGFGIGTIAGTATGASVGNELSKK
ncbi:glycine zipper family protein [Peribacillus asahii]|uniref:glycine zipper family protein n=1 Tax=Peribacillus asahii TaxID=228899 RepID=UPI00207B05FE|nr:glycine zipper family protein [Peribacillus asahii]USK86150.1 glycine zipper family protein [Peribacillus asahii]